MRIWPLATCKSGSRLFHFQAHHVRKAPFATKKHGAIPISLGVRKDGSCADTFMVTFWPCSVVMRNKWRSRSPSHQDTLSLRIALQGESSAIFLKEKRNPQKYKGLPKVSFTEKYGVFSGRGDRFRTCGLVVPNHARYQLRHTSLRPLLPWTTIFILYCIFTLSVNGISSVSPQFE